MSVKFDGVFLAQTSANQAPTYKRGAGDPTDLYAAVGLALSTWEQCEDFLMGLFVDMCGRDTLAAEWYVAVKSRDVRAKSFTPALERHQRGTGPDKLPSAMLAALKRAIKEMNGLAETRNRIAHSSCVKLTATENMKLSLEGYFLVPAMNEIGIPELALRYALNADDIAEFTARAAKCRDVLDSAHSHIIEQRSILRRNLPQEATVLLSLAKGAVEDDGKIELMLKAVELTDQGRSLAPWLK